MPGHEEPAAPHPSFTPFQQLTHYLACSSFRTKIRRFLRFLGLAEELRLPGLAAASLESFRLNFHLIVELFASFLQLVGEELLAVPLVVVAEVEALQP